MRIFSFVGYLVCLRVNWPRSGKCGMFCVCEGDLTERICLLMMGIGKWTVSGGCGTLVTVFHLGKGSGDTE